jgi:hypothetical protein
LPVVTAEPLADGESGVASGWATPAGAGLMAAPDAANFGCPKSGWRALQAATTCGAICGNGRAAAAG